MKSRLKNLVELSYTDGELNQKNIEIIANKLTRKDLKTYIRLLKQEEDKKIVYVTSAQELTDGSRKMVENRFPDKKILYQVDPRMINGVRIVEIDNEYEMSLNQTFDDIIGYLTKYD